MRYIDPDLTRNDPLASVLIEAAEVVRAEMLEAEDAEARDSLIDGNRTKWTAFRALFEDLYGAKCWYTESENPGTDDDIDHFRPKKALAGDTSHGGYWWEAFNWENFRLSSHRANRRRENPEAGVVFGKGDHFPLLDEALRWRAPAEECRELPTLLDPTDPKDPLLITFDMDGRISLSPDHDNCPVASVRVERSRELLHLDWPDFVKQRRDLYARIRDRVKTGDGGVKAFVEGADAGSDIVKDAATELIALTADDRAYSRAAAAFIRIFKDRSWIDRAVLPYIPADQ